MADGVLYTYPENFRAYKALIAAQYSGAKVTVDPNFEFGVTNKSEAFLKQFPAGKVPAYKSADGKVLLTESNAIAFYVANAALRGATTEAQAQVWMWSAWADLTLLPPACALVFPYLGIMSFNKQNVERARSDLIAALKILDDTLLTKTFLVGERVTLADIIVFTTLLNPIKYVLDPATLSPYINLSRWLKTVAHQPQVASVVGDVVYCQEPPSVPNNNQVKHNKARNAPKKEGEKRKEKKVETKPEPKVEAANNEVAGDAEEPAAPQFKSTFDMDEFKRCYSNEDEAVSIPFFWEKFDHDNFSIWYAEYKYPEELAKVFMSCNLITGMFQRLEKMRKIAFASVCLFGGDNDSSISGVWVWRGQDLAFLQSPDWQIDYESYEWKKLDSRSEETKKLVEQYFSWTGTDSKERKFNQGKVFK